MPEVGTKDHCASLKRTQFVLVAIFFAVLLNGVKDSQAKLLSKAESIKCENP